MSYRYIKYYSLGVGTSGYTEPSPQSQGFFNKADNGLSKSTITPDDVVLGQNVGQLGNPAQLLSDREIPMGAHVIELTNGSNVIGFIVNTTTAITMDALTDSQINMLGAGISFQLDISATGMLMTLPGSGLFSLGCGATNNILGLSGGLFSTEGFAAGIRTTSLAGDTVGLTDTTIICDTSGGNITIHFDPTAVPGQMAIIKKKGTDANTVTIVPSSGQIFADAGGQANYVLTSAGQAAMVQADGTNLFVL